MRKKGLAGILSLLICIAIVGVGFASWVISGNATEDVTGNIEVDQVIDNRITMVITKTDITVRLAGKPSEPTAEYKWLNNDGLPQDLDLELSYTLSFKDSNKNDYANINVSAVLDTIPTNIQACITNNYIKLSDSSIVITPSEDKKTGTIVVTFAWGTAFNGNNPYDYFNTLPSSDENVSKAKTALDALYATKDETITIKVAATYTPTV